MALKDKLKKHTPVLIAVGITAAVSVIVTKEVVMRRTLGDMERTAMAGIDVIMDLGGDPQKLIPEKITKLFPQK